MMAMNKPFDATMRKLIELEPAGWLRFLHISVTNPERVLVIDSNLSTVTADADKVLLVDEPLPWIEHVELQAGRDTELPDRVHGYSTLLRRSHKMPVHTTIQAATIWAATKILLGLRYSIVQVEEMVRGVSTMILGIRGIEESSVYQDIFAKGEAKGLSEGRVEGRVEGRTEGLTEGRIGEARRVMLELGCKKFGEPEEAVRARISASDDVDQLNALLARILDVTTWDELLRPN
jgi:predicted transposase YdaD